MTSPINIFDAELGVLHQLLEHSRDHFYRRVERVVLHDAHCERWVERATVHVPFDLRPRDQLTETKPLCLSIGLFPKERHPDLQVKVNGANVSLLSSDDTARILGLIFTEHIVNRDMTRATVAALSATEAEIDAVANTILFFATEVLRSDKDKATEALEVACRTMESEPDSRLAKIYQSVLASGFIRQLEPMATTVHVLVEAPRDSRNLMDLEIEYSNRSNRGFRSIERPEGAIQHEEVSRVIGFFEGMNERWQAGWKRCSMKSVYFASLGLLPLLLIDWSVKFLAALGFVGTPVAFRRPNLDHCKSFYLLLDLPADVSCDRLYWRTLEHVEIDRQSPPVATSYPVLSSSWLDPKSRLRMWDCVAELRPNSINGPASHLSTVAACLCAITCGFLYRNFVPVDDPAAKQVAIGIAALAGALPGAALGALSVSGSSISRRLSRGLRIASGTSALCVVAAGFSLALFREEHLTTYRVIAWVASVASFLVATTLVARNLVHHRSAPAGRASDKDRNSAAISRHRERRWSATLMLSCCIATWWWALALLNPTQGVISNPGGLMEHIEYGLNRQGAQVTSILEMTRTQVVLGLGVLLVVYVLSAAASHLIVGARLGRPTQ